MAGLKLGTSLGLFLMVALVLFVMVNLSRSPLRAPKWTAYPARMPCLADNYCPVGQKCAGGFCSEGFQSDMAPPQNVAANAPVDRPDVDMSSCNAPECKGINATCGRKETPCPEGTFCQNDACVDVEAPDSGEAYNQIGMIL
jgi:hypothetical protein